MASDNLNIMSAVSCSEDAEVLHSASLEHHLPEMSFIKFDVRLGTRLSGLAPGAVSGFRQCLISAVRVDKTSFTP